VGFPLPGESSFASNMMAGHSPQPRVENERRSFGPRTMAELVPTVARRAFGRAALGVTQLLEAWPGIVGPALAAETSPRRLIQGTLTISCSGPTAMELQHFSTEIMQRINRYLGSTTVRRLRFRQMAGVQARPSQKPHSPRMSQATAAVSSMPDGPLREALISLGNALLSG
jgi:hypothetical protein